MNRRIENPVNKLRAMLRMGFLVFYLGISGPAISEDLPGPLMEMILANARGTVLTCLIRVDGAEVLEPAGKKSKSGYLEFQIRGRVLEALKGKVDSTLVFAKGGESGSKPPAAGDTLLVSLAKTKEGKYYLPDVGYDIPITGGMYGGVIELLAENPQKIESEK